MFSASEWQQVMLLLSVTVVVCMLLHLTHSCLCTTIGRPRSSGSVFSSECHLVVLLDAQPVAGKPRDPLLHPDAAIKEMVLDNRRMPFSAMIPVLPCSQP